MRVLFAPHTSPSHYLPVAPLAQACRAAGHEVRVAVQPPLVDVVQKSGHVPVTMGAGYDHETDLAALLRDDMRTYGRPLTADLMATLAPEAREGIRNRMRDCQIRIAEAVIEELLRFTRTWRADIVVADPMMLAAPLAAEVTGIPLVHYTWAPDYLRHQVGFPGVGMPVDRWPETLVRLFARFGAQPRPEYAGCTLDPWPDSLQLPGMPNRVPYRYVPYNGPGTVPDLLWREPRPRRRICVTWGTVATRRTGPEGFLVPRVIEGLAGSDAEIVLALAPDDADRLGTLPHNVRVTSGTPLHVLLPECDAIIHQGGGGTTLTAAACGVPQAVLALAADLRLNATQLAKAGAGLALEPGRTGPADIRAAADALLEDRDLRAAATRLQEEIRAQPSPARIVPVLEGKV
ncbi:nucleotide disphospho-sugar-binding domain-containing protein [Streptomyces malaysiense]|uniref:Uncharacterized protein n=1 Tax=Streptomyces malaysiense TaxID=1428626 RepID=A0A1J4Q539_9ACTN|nr:nucleotide disphospho-sugar-binding domain-containing protein [Streptomyces malaysiense]OIK27486.1 hypothetical protein VT52_011295 [Streptomyces malaysiense]